MSINYKKLIEIARALKGKNVPVKCFHVSYVFNKSKLLSIGINKYKSHPQTRNFDYSIHSGVHSELDAVKKLGILYKDNNIMDCSHLTLVNVRIDNNNEVGNSEPCFGCQSLIRALKIKKVIYTNNRGEFINK